MFSLVENVTMHCVVIIYVYFMVNKPFEFEFEFENKLVAHKINNESNLIRPSFPLELVH